LSVQQKSLAIFSRLAQAEEKVHGITLDKVHFHEVGAVDALVDIVGSVVGLELLGITGVAASAINVGSGTVDTAHGILPVPAPATAEMLAGIPFYQSSTMFELTTPTGAAIISTLGTSFGPLQQMKVNRIAYGAGDQDFSGRPNILRLMIGERAAPYGEDVSIIIETNIDDLNPQVYDYLIGKLMEQGAQDAFLTPIIMKKGRPAVLLSVITDPSKTDVLVDTIFRETTSIGVRIRETGRKKLDREMREIYTDFGRIRIKISRRGSEVLSATPEYEDCLRIAERSNVALKTVIEAAKRAWSGG
jgi:uncharacterized protein (TIGR00299 family) protein